jgi:hypothetical protein
LSHLPLLALLIVLGIALKMSLVAKAEARRREQIVLAGSACRAIFRAWRNRRGQIIIRRFWVKR